MSKCDLYDYSLTEAARVDLRRGNTVICKCVHCRQQGKENIQHTAKCCFYPAKKTFGQAKVS